MSAPGAKRGGSESPGDVRSNSGHGCGLAAQKASKSSASAAGNITRFACT